MARRLILITVDSLLQPSHASHICSLLKDPHFLHELVKHIVGLTEGRVPVSVKMRAGFRDSSLFLENALGIEAAGASFVTIHPRTRSQAYSGQADWSLITQAKQTLSIPVVCIPGFGCETRSNFHG